MKGTRAATRAAPPAKQLASCSAKKAVAPPAGRLPLPRQRFAAARECARRPGCGRNSLKTRHLMRRTVVARLSHFTVRAANFAGARRVAACCEAAAKRISAFREFAARTPPRRKAREQKGSRPIACTRSSPIRRASRRRRIEPEYEPQRREERERWRSSVRINAVSRCEER